MFRNFKDASRNTGWGRDLCSAQVLSLEELRLGAELRIADAVELMAKNHQELINERDRYRLSAERRLQEITQLSRHIAGLRGYISKLKRTSK